MLLRDFFFELAYYSLHTHRVVVNFFRLLFVFSYMLLRSRKFIEEYQKKFISGKTFLVTPNVHRLLDLGYGERKIVHILEFVEIMLETKTAV